MLAQTFCEDSPLYVHRIELTERFVKKSWQTGLIRWTVMLSLNRCSTVPQTYGMDEEFERCDLRVT